MKNLSKVNIIIKILSILLILSMFFTKVSFATDLESDDIASIMNKASNTNTSKNTTQNKNTNTNTNVNKNVNSNTNTNTTTNKVVNTSTDKNENLPSTGANNAKLGLLAIICGMFFMYAMAKRNYYKNLFSK